MEKEKKITEKNFDSYDEHHKYAKPIYNYEHYSHAGESVIKSILYPTHSALVHRFGNFWCKHTKYPYIAFEFILEGSRSYIQNGIAETAHAGDIYIVHQNVDTEILALAEDKYYVMQVVIVGGAFAPILLEQLQLKNVNIIKIQDIETMKNRFNKILTAMRDEDSIVAISQTYELLLAIHQECYPKTNTFPEKLNQILHAINIKLSSGIQIQELVEEYGISSTTLYRLFMDNLGKSPQRYLIEQRLSKAKLLLMDSNLSIKEIADKLGYKNQLHFSSVFKKEYGVSPKNYQKNAK